MKKIYVIIVVLLAIAVAGLAVYRYAYLPWRADKQERINIGLSSPTFPYRDYSQEELNKKYPQVKNTDVPTRVTPEETYAKFRQGLKENNLEMVLEQLYKDSPRYDDNVVSIKKAYEEERFVEIYGKYPEKIEKSWEGDTVSQYEYGYYRDEKERSYMIEFKKNSDGVWLIDIL